MQTVAFIQARLTSTRLPGKVLEKVGPWTVLEWMTKRLSKAKTLDSAVFIIPDTKPNDDLAAYLANTLKAPYVRGSEDDVLGRFADAAAQYPADRYVRLTGDCPLVCPELVDRVVQLAASGEFAYVSNVDPPTYADGFDVECLSAAALRWADASFSRQSWREHVTLGLRQSEARPTHFRFSNVEFAGDASDWIRMTLDNAADLRMLRELYALLGETMLDMNHDELQKAYVNSSMAALNGRTSRIQSPLAATDE